MCLNFYTCSYNFYVNNFYVYKKSNDTRNVIWTFMYAYIVSASHGWLGKQTDKLLAIKC